MHLEILVEEPSAEVALKNILPFILPIEITYNIITHQGKNDLLKKLEMKLRAYKKWITDEYRIVVLIDRDNDDCKDLKKKLNAIALNAGLRIKAQKVNNTQSYQILNRIAIEELEAWFLGDSKAILKVYERIAEKDIVKLYKSSPDEIINTWETLEVLLKTKGYFTGGLRKIECSESISKYMDVDNNKSGSFRCFRDGIRALVNQ